MREYQPGKPFPVAARGRTTYPRRGQWQLQGELRGVSSSCLASCPGPLPSQLSEGCTSMRFSSVLQGGRSGASCVDGLRLARENVTCRTEVACSHVSGLFTQS